MDEAVDRVRQEVDPDANIIFGATFDEALGDKVRVSIVASGMRVDISSRPQRPATARDRRAAARPAAARLPRPACRATIA